MLIFLGGRSGVIMREQAWWSRGAIEHRLLSWFYVSLDTYDCIQAIWDACGDIEPKDLTDLIGTPFLRRVVAPPREKQDRQQL